MLATGFSHIIVNDPVASNPQLDIHLEDGSNLRLGVIFDNAEFEIGNLTGESGTFVYPNYKATKLPVVRTLKVNQTVDGVFAGTLGETNNSRDLGFSKSGSAILELTHPLNEYSGATTISEGRLRISGAGRLNYRPDSGGALTLGEYPGNITNDAILHFDSTATQELSGSFSGNGQLLKSNIGFLTLSGDGSAFSGDTAVQGGRLIVDGSLGGDIWLAANTSVGGIGSTSGHLSTGVGSSLILNGDATTAGLTVHGATIADPTYIEFAAPQLDGVIYEVLNYGAGGLTGYDNLVALGRGVLSHDTINQRVIFTAEAPAVRTWDGGDGVWNSLKVLQNWSEGDQLFFQGDTVIFDAISSDATVTLDGVLAPASVTVQHPANTYTFAGGASGGIAGGGTFTKTSTGTLRIASASPNFFGPTSINGGIFRLIDEGQWGTGPIANEASLEVERSADLTLINACLAAALKPHGIFTSGMVLQRDKPTVIWGWAAAGADVSVTLGDKTEQATASDGEGRWEVGFPARAADASPHRLTIRSGDQEVVMDNIVFGDVWVMNGQSNMAWALGKMGAPASTGESSQQARRPVAGETGGRRGPPLLGYPREKSLRHGQLLQRHVWRVQGLSYQRGSFSPRL